MAVPLMKKGTNGKVCKQCAVFSKGPDIGENPKQPCQAGVQWASARSPGLTTNTQQESMQKKRLKTPAVRQKGRNKHSGGTRQSREQVIKKHVILL